MEREETQEDIIFSKEITVRYTLTKIAAFNYVARKYYDDVFTDHYNFYADNDEQAQEEIKMHFGI